MMEIIPSVFATNEREYIKRFDVASSLSKRVHIDVMDGMFVKIRSPSLNVLGKIPGTRVEVHLMVKDALPYVGLAKEIGAKRVYLHVENYPDEKQMMQDIFIFKEVGIRAGIAVNPETPLADIKDYLDVCDSILLMSVKPGKEGQKFFNPTLFRLSELRKMTKKEIGIDGGINRELLETLEERGADFAVVGSAIFSKEK